MNEEGLKKKKKRSFHKKDIGIVGAIILLSQTISSYYSTERISKELDQLKSRFENSLLDRDHSFARKSDLNLVNRKIDQVKEEVVKINDKLDEYHAFKKKDEEEGFEPVGYCIYSDGFKEELDD